VDIVGAMRKIFGCIFIVVVVAVVIGLIAIFNANTFVSWILSSKLEVPVRIHDMKFRPPEIRLKGIKIGNPKGYREHEAISIASIDITAPYTNYLDKEVEIDSIILDDVTLTIEFFGDNHVNYNWNVLLTNMNKDDSAKAGKSKKSGRSAFIKTLKINKLKIVTVVPGHARKVQEIPDLTFHNLSTKEGNLSAQITQTILFHLLFNTKNFLKFPLQTTEETFQNLLSPFNKPAKQPSK